MARQNWETILIEQDQLCAGCGKAIPLDSPSGVCPSCMLGNLLGSADADLAEDSDDLVTVAAIEQPGMSTIEQIGKYRIIRKLGRGGMGYVWLAEHPTLDIPVAIKTLPHHLVAREPVPTESRRPRIVMVFAGLVVLAAALSIYTRSANPPPPTPAIVERNPQAARPLASTDDETQGDLPPAMPVEKEQVDGQLKQEPATPDFPENTYHRMTATNNVRASEKGHKIIAELERKGPAVEGKRLVLVIKADSYRNSNSSNKVVIRDESTGQLVGHFIGIGKGRSRRVPLTLAPQQTVKLVIANHGGDVLRLKRHKKGPAWGSAGVPELFLDLVDDLASKEETTPNEKPAD
jgi:hypothetical protein